MYQIELRHNGLKKYRVIRGNDRYIVEEKARMQEAAWAEQWQKKQYIKTQKQRRETAVWDKEAKRLEALRQTREAQANLTGFEKILEHTLHVDDTLCWKELQSTQHFPEPRPAEPEQVQVPPPPHAEDVRFQPKLTLVDYLIPPLRVRKIEEANADFRDAYRYWERGAAKIADENAQRHRAYQDRFVEWKARKEAFEAHQAAENSAVAALELKYRQKNADAVMEYCDLILSKSDYPDCVPKEWNIDYDQNTSLLSVDYMFPSTDKLPTLKEVRYIASRDRFEEINLKDREVNKLYDHLVYQICLRTVHELFEADAADAISCIVFNGWVNYIDRGTGNNTQACIMSMQTTKAEFMSLNLAEVEPAACFRTLKGVGSSQLHAMAAVAPILQLNRDDPRFVASIDVADKLKEGTNLAAIGWEEFEHLIREIFGREFSKSGGEVKVTQASRDGGVDAIAFDPDPLRGGKIVIQAKRYANPVGVSSVRDLYGTVMNEGAIKGILVTTSTFGPDAYAFARNKPLALLDGANLLHLLGQHGHKARINLAEAKKLGMSLKR